MLLRTDVSVRLFQFPFHCVFFSLDYEVAELLIQVNLVSLIFYTE